MSLDIEKILIMQLGSIGEVVLSTPMIKKLRNNYPNSQIMYLATETGAEIVKGNSRLDDVLILEKERFKRIKEEESLFSALQVVGPLIEEIKDNNFDAVIDLDNTFASSVITFLSSANHKLGFKDSWRSIVYNKKLKIQSQMHIVDQYLKLLEKLEIEELEEEQEFEVIISEQDEGYVDSLFGRYDLNNEAKLIIFNLNSKEANTWSLDKFVELGKWFNEHTNSKLLIVGAKEYKNKADKISNKIRAKVLNLVGELTAGQLAEVISRVDLVITPASSELYLAQVLDIPLLALFGELDSAVVGPYEGNNVVINSSTGKIADISINSVINHLDLVNPNLKMEG